MVAVQYDGKTNLFSVLFQYLVFLFNEIPSAICNNNYISQFYSHHIINPWDTINQNIHNFYSSAFYNYCMSRIFIELAPITKQNSQYTVHVLYFKLFKYLTHNVQRNELINSVIQLLVAMNASSFLNEHCIIYASSFFTDWAKKQVLISWGRYTSYKLTILPTLKPF